MFTIAQNLFCAIVIDITHFLPCTNRFSSISRCIFATWRDRCGFLRLPVNWLRPLQRENNPPVGNDAENQAFIRWQCWKTSHKGCKESSWAKRKQVFQETREVSVHIVVIIICFSTDCSVDRLLIVYWSLLWEACWASVYDSFSLTLTCYYYVVGKQVSWARYIQRPIKTWNVLLAQWLVTLHWTHY